MWGIFDSTDDQDSSITLSNEEELGRDDLLPTKASKKVDAKTNVKKVKTKTAADDLESGSEDETPTKVHKTRHVVV